MSTALIPALRALSDDIRHFDKGALLFAQRDKVQSLHLIETGAVHLVRHQIGGFALTLHRADAGAILAEASLFSERYHCDAVAQQPTRTVCIPKATVQAEMTRDPALTRAWAVFLTREVQATRARAEILALRTVANRLDAWLAMRGGDLPDKGGWKSVAGEIGVSAEALYRELARRRRGNTS